jgi:hypothetical protein
MRRKGEISASAPEPTSLSDRLVRNLPLRATRRAASLREIGRSVADFLCAKLSGGTVVERVAMSPLGEVSKEFDVQRTDATKRC